jgi:hypothetical protein
VHAQAAAVAADDTCLGILNLTLGLDFVAAQLTRGFG